MRRPGPTLKLDLKELLEHAEGVCEFAPFTTIFDAGSAGDYLYVLLEGEVTISINGADIWKLRAGEIFGEMALIDHRPRSAAAITTTSVRAVRIDEQGFISLVQRMPRFSLHVMRVMAARLRALDETLV